MKKYKAKSIFHKDLTPTVRHFVFDLGEGFDFKAGQFVNLYIKQGEKILRKPYSIASNPNKSNQIEFCIKHVEDGSMTPHLFSLDKGFEVEIMGPLGLFNLDLIGDSEKIVFIGAGTGVAPLRSMIKEILAKEVTKEVTLIFGVRDENHILYKDEFEEMSEKHPNFKFVPIVSRPSEKWQGRQGYVHQNFDVIDPLNSEFFICGLTPMIEDSRKKLLELGALESSIHSEKFV